MNQSASDLFIVDNSDADWKVRSKDSKGRTLSDDDIVHFQRVVALSGTIRLIAEIDRVIKAHGGWPGTFQSATTGKNSAE